MTPVGTAALAAHEAGLSVVPPVEDGTKAPDGAWKRYQAERADAAQLGAWYADGRRSGLGVVCGAVSGGLECLDFDSEATLRAFVAAADATGLGGLVDAITTGYCEATPGGYHWFYRCAGVAGNTKLARRADPATGEVEVLIETRGEGGYAIVAPTNGRVHPSGGRYELVSGGFASIATISPADRFELHRLARSFDELPKAEPATAAAGSRTGDGTRPGDDYNARTDWPQILEPAGWTHVYRRGDVSYWRRPGKDRGISATTNYGGSGLLWVFSTSTPFAAERSYDRFGAHAALHHGGDLAEAGRALRREGYGQATTRYTLTVGEGARPEAASEFLPPPVGAIHGWIGDYCRLVEPTTEAGMAFHLGSALTVVGAILGRHVSAWYSSARLYGNLFTVLVGDSGSTKKDTAIKRALHVLNDPGAGGTVVLNHGIMIVTDVGSSTALVNDLKNNPNVLLYMTEMSKLIGNARRKGSETILPTIMAAFDTPAVLQNKSMANPIEARLPYLAMLSGVQPEILSGLVTSEDLASGFANRMFFVCGDPKAPLAEPPEVDWPALRGLFADLWRRRQSYAEGAGLKLAPDALAIWKDWYDADWYAIKGSPAEERALRQRHHVFVRKIAFLYAVCDGAQTVSRDHLDRSIGIVAWMWRNIATLAASWGRSIDGQIETRIMAVLAQRGAMRRRMLQQQCTSRKWSAIEFARVFDAMARNQTIVVDQAGVVGLAGDDP